MATKSRPRTLPLGTYAADTCRADHRFTALRDELSALHLQRADRTRLQALSAEFTALPLDDDDDQLTDEQCETLDYVLQELCAIAEGYLPPYSYLGNLEGDGACFGVWADTESALRDLRDGELWSPCARGDGYSKPGTILLAVPKGELYLSVSDHGNVSLYRSLGAGKSREIWGVV